MNGKEKEQLFSSIYYYTILFLILSMLGLGVPGIRILAGILKRS